MNFWLKSRTSKSQKNMCNEMFKWLANHKPVRFYRWFIKSDGVAWWISLFNYCYVIMTFCNLHWYASGQWIYGTHRIEQLKLHIAIDCIEIEQRNMRMKKVAEAFIVDHSWDCTLFREFINYSKRLAVDKELRFILLQL